MFDLHFQLGWTCATIVLLPLSKLVGLFGDILSTYLALGACALGAFSAFLFYFFAGTFKMRIPCMNVVHYTFASMLLASSIIPYTFTIPAFWQRLSAKTD